MDEEQEILQRWFDADLISDKRFNQFAQLIEYNEAVLNTTAILSIVRSILSQLVDNGLMAAQPPCYSYGVDPIWTPEPTVTADYIFDINELPNLCI